MNRIAGLFLLLCALPAGADDIPVTTEAAIARALAHRAEMRAEDAQVAAAAARLAAAEGVFWPRFDAYADTQHARTYDDYSGIEVRGEFAGTPISVSVERVLAPYQAFAGIESTLSLYAGGAHTAGARAARAELLAAHAQRELTRRQLIFDAAAGYWELRKAQMRFARAQLQAEHALATARIVEAQWQVGRVSALARERALLATLEAEMNLRQAERVRDDRWQSYRSVLVLPAAEMPALTDDPAQFDFAAVKAALFDKHQDRHPLAVKLQAQTEAAGGRARAARAPFYPQVELFGRVQAAGRDDAGFVGAWSDLRRQDEIVGVRLRWNLFNGGKTRARAAEAQAEATLAQLRSEQGARERAERARERASAVARAEDALALAQRRRDLVRQEQAVAKARRELQQITAVQYQAAELATAEADEQLSFAHIERLLAQLATYL